MEPFLYTVAQWLNDKYSKDFSKIKLVFPNRRTSVFFLEHLQQIIDKPIWVPQIQTISEFISEFSELELAESIDLLSKLYSIYKKESGSIESFDEFYFWAELMLNDFNDIDKYLVDAEIVLKNVKSIKEIEDDISFLTEEQINVLKRFFTNFSPDKQTQLKDNFLQIWQVLLPTYKEFSKLLINEKKGYEGLIYKTALEFIKQCNVNELEFEKVIFVGFNALTPCEEEIFSIFKNVEMAEFCWDYDNYYISNKAMDAGLFQRRFIEKYPNPGLKNNFDNLLAQKKIIHLISTPTDHGQVQISTQIINKINTKNFSNTALILSDEQLLLPVLNSIPKVVDSVNITMGFPVSDTLSGNFLDLIISLYQSQRISKNLSVSYYYKSIVPILRHPFVQFINKELCSEKIKAIESENLYQIELNDLQDSELFKRIFINCTTAKKFGNNLSELLLFIQSKLWNSENEEENFKLEKEFLFEIYQQNNQLLLQLKKSELDILLATYFRLLKKVVLSIRTPFEGEPINGLQIMGFLETRNLDFENVIILSVNEGLLPASSQSPSFIPYSLRRGFGLPTSDLHDAMYAYYFYRIIQRAKNVYLIYNSGSGGMQSSEKSRFAYQLLFDTNFQVNEIPVSQTIEVLSNQTIEIEKDQRVFKKLNTYLNSEKTLSPSALSTYLSCSLRFYYRYIAGIKEPFEVDEKVDARLFGNIFHLAAEKLYDPYKQKNILVTIEELQKLEKDTKQLDTIIISSFKEVFFGEKSKRQFTIEGKNQIVFNVIKKYLLQLIKKDKEVAPFSIVGLEQNIKHPIQFKIKGKNYSVLIGGQIDRVDKTETSLRIIDYKTGADKLEFNHIDDVFDHDKISDTKAVFQTFTYALLMAQNEPLEPFIKPMVYQIKSIFAENQSFEITSKSFEPFSNGNFKDIEGLVLEGLQNTLSELFNPDVSFTQSKNLKTCKTCTFKDFCGR
ncbi:MAG: PD-(D/E)XK nuclease family protein [Salinivirgaceae bacterium]|nr:PD-(D/E)XK nuclease family protein [Salinivirgaceae bacterium]